MRHKPYSKSYVMHNYTKEEIYQLYADEVNNYNIISKILDNYTLMMNCITDEANADKPVKEVLDMAYNKLERSKNA